MSRYDKNGNDRPNILIIIVDQQRADVCGCYGGLPSMTPNLDRLASNVVLIIAFFK